MPFFQDLALVSLNIAALSITTASATQYYCDDGRDTTVSSGTFTGMKIDDGCYVKVNDGVSLSGFIKISDGSKLTIDDATLSDVTIDAQDGSYVTITSTSSSAESEISVNCQSGSEVKFNGEELCSYRRRGARVGLTQQLFKNHRTRRRSTFSCDDEGHKTLSSGSYSSMQIEDECDVIINEGVSLSGTIRIEDESKLYVTDATLSDVTLYVEDESYVSITSSGDRSDILAVHCEDESKVLFNGEDIC
eukprot:Awhi_evm1s12548